MKSSKKAQAAMEFLSTYGWAIFIALAAVGSLAYFGVFNADTWIPSKCVVRPGFSCMEHKVTPHSDGATLYLKIHNNLGTDAKLSNLTLTSLDCVFPIGEIDMTGGSVFKNGQTWSSSMNCVHALGPGNSLSSKERFRATFTINYQKVGETQTHLAKGEISTKVEN